MIKFKVKEILEKKDISRYRLQQLTNWNYKRVNAYYLGKVVSINVEELNKLSSFMNETEYSNKTCNFITEASFLNNAERIILGNSFDIISMMYNCVQLYALQT